MNRTRDDQQQQSNKERRDSTWNDEDDDRGKGKKQRFVRLVVVVDDDGSCHEEVGIRCTPTLPTVSLSLLLFRSFALTRRRLMTFDDWTLVCFSVVVPTNDDWLVLYANMAAK